MADRYYRSKSKPANQWRKSSHHSPPPSAMPYRGWRPKSNKIRNKLLENTDISPNHRPPPPEQPYPWLILWKDKKRKTQAFCNITKPTNQAHWRNIPELRNKTVKSCCKQWLFLADNKNDHHYSLWNLSTLESITLPPLKLSCPFVNFYSLLTAPPGSTDSMVILFERCRHEIVYLRLRGCSSDKWTEVQFEEELKLMEFTEKNHCGGFMTPTCCNGVIYVTSFYYDLFILDFVEDSNKFVLRNLKTRLHGGEYNNSLLGVTRLVESAGELYSVDTYEKGFRNNEVIFIEVFKLDMSRMEWDKVDNIKDQVFFLGDLNYNVSCPSSGELQKNCIYFCARKELYSYNVKDKSLSLVYRPPKLKSLMSSITWVMPDYRFIDDQDCPSKKLHESEGCVRASFSGEKDSLCLPQELIEVVARKLVLLDYMNFRAVCRDFMLAAPAIQWRDVSPDADSLSPWLVFIGKDRKVMTFIDPVHNGSYFIRLPSELEDGTIHCSKYGWLLMSRNQNSLFFFNPFTKSVMPVPDLTACFRNEGFDFSAEPTSSGCDIIGVTCLGRGIGLDGINYGLRDDDWGHAELIDGVVFELNHNAPVLWNENYYCLCREGKLGVVYVSEDETFSWKVRTEIEPPCVDFVQGFLVGCENELISVFVGKFGIWVKVFRLDMSDLTWKEVNSLGNKTIFVSRSSTICTVAKSKEMENKIYFTRLHKESLVFYSFETRKFHAADGYNSEVDYSDTRELLLCSWIEPRWAESHL